MLTVTTSGCPGDDSASPPERLAGGSRATQPRVELERVESRGVLTELSVLTADAVEPGSRLESCLRARHPARPSGPIVVRTGVESATVTFRDPSGRWLHGCDDVVPTTDRTWCGGASGRLFDGRLRDARLRLAACSTSVGEPVAFAWVEPSSRTRYLVVRRSGYVEVYEAASGLPIRISTIDGADVEDARASFELSEHDAGGDVVREYTLEAKSAG